MVLFDEVQVILIAVDLLADPSFELADHLRLLYLFIADV